MSPESKGWEVLDLTDNKVVRSVKVIFYETLSLEVWKEKYGPVSRRTQAHLPTDTSMATVLLFAEVDEPSHEDVVEVLPPSPVLAPPTPVADRPASTPMSAIGDERSLEASPVALASGIASGQQDAKLVDQDRKPSTTGEQQIGEPVEQEAAARVHSTEELSKSAAGEESTDSDVVEVSVGKPKLRRTVQTQKLPERLVFQACLPPAAFVMEYNDAKDDVNLPELNPDSLELNQHHHVMHLLPEVDCVPKAWTVLKELHAPTSIVATLMLERELSALRLSEGELVQPVLDKIRDLYANLPQNQSLWTLEWVRTKILEEDFRRRKLRGGDDGNSSYGMQGSRRGRGRGFGGAGRGAKKDDDSNDQQGGTGWGRGAKSGRGGKSDAGGKMKGSCWYCEKEGHPWFLCYKKPDGWTPQNRHQDGIARRNQKNGANMVADLSDKKSKGGAEKKKERTAGQFFHIGEQGEQGDAFAKFGAELHPLDYWVLDMGAAWTMTPRKELLDDANLISLRKLAKAGVSTSTDEARTYNRQQGNRVLWDQHESKDVYGSMWQLLALAWHGGGQAGEGSASQGECNAVGGVGVKLSARSGETDWATAHRCFGHRDWQEQEAFGAGSHRLGGSTADWLPFMEKQAECVVKRIRTDRGGEFLGAEMTAWLKKQGIQRELTTAYTPQSNGVAERANRTILETARALLIESGVGNSMWPHAVRHANVARNRVLTKGPPSPGRTRASSVRLVSE
ncbi:unnamed protein product [Closterium sp. NIES-53]